MLRKCNRSIFEIEHGSMGWAFHWGVKRDTKSVTRARRPRTPPDPKNPVFGPAKKSSLPPAKMCKKWGFWAKKRAFSVNLCTILHKNDLFFADIAPRYRAASPSGKNPPIYTVLNAAFSAPGPPRLWHRGGTPVPDALPRAPDAHFSKIAKKRFLRNTMMGVGFLLRHFLSIYNWNLIYLILIYRDFRFWRIAPWRQHIPLARRSVVTNRPQNRGSMLSFHRKKNNS
jgi:hypothetical protein